LASARTAAAVAAPRPRSKARPAPPRTRPRTAARRRPRARGAIVWIALGAVVLAGVVFVNLAVLRLNLQLDSATKDRTELLGQNANLQSELSSALASPRIQALARSKDGLVPADPSTIGYIDLASR
jgi:cell division protein FtsL